MFFFISKISRRQVRFFANGRRSVIWPAYVEHLGRRISLPFEWDAESSKNRSLRIKEVKRLFQMGLGNNSPVVYLFQKYQVVGDEFKVVSFSKRKKKLCFPLFFTRKKIGIPIYDCFQVGQETDKWTGRYSRMTMAPVYKEIGYELVRLPWDWVRKGHKSARARVAEARETFRSLSRLLFVTGQKWRIINGVLEHVSFYICIYSDF